MKSNLTFIADRTKQFRMVDDENKEQWFQQCSVYKCAKAVKRGQPVSIYTLDQMKYDIDIIQNHPEDWVYEDDIGSGDEAVAYIRGLIDSDDAYVVPTNLWKHSKVVGLALEPGAKGSEIHIQSTGTFTYALPSNKFYTGDANEYVPEFRFDDSVGKAVFVAGNQDRSINVEGKLTIADEQSFTGFDNIIHIGYISDAPLLDTQDEIKIELQINGDVRGPIDNTQFFATLGDKVTIPSANEIKVFAVGQEENRKFEGILSLTKSNLVGQNFFLAVQRLDGKTAFLNISGFNPDTVTDDNDRRFVKIAQEYAAVAGVENAVINLDSSKYANLSSFVEEVKSKMNEAFAFVADSFTGIDIDTKEVVSYNPTSLTFKDVTELSSDTSKVVRFIADDFGGYYKLYVCKKLLNSSFKGTEQLSGGSVYNKGYAVIADCRIPERCDNLLGVYYGHIYDKELLPLSKADFMKAGLFELNKYKQADENLLEVGKAYYLGHNGNITTSPNISYDFSIQIGTAQTRYKLIVNCDKTTSIDRKDYPVGYIKPCVGGVPETSFFLMDGVTEHSIETYNDLYSKLQGWYPQSMLTDGVTEGFFVIPKHVFRNYKDGTDEYAQIKFVSDGHYREIPYEPFKRLFGKFASSDVEARPNVEELDVTDLCSLHPIEDLLEPNDLEAFNIKLFVDIDRDPNDETSPYNWTEIPQGFTLYDTSNKFGFRWQLYSKNGRVYLKSDLMDSAGIAYSQSKNTPPTLLYNKPYKIWVCKREYFNKSFDIRNLFESNIAHTVSRLNGDFIPSINALMDFIEQGITIDSVQIAGDSIYVKDSDLKIHNENVEISGGVSIAYDKNSAKRVAADDGVQKSYKDYDNTSDYDETLRGIKNTLVYEGFTSEELVENAARPTTLVPYAWLKSHENNKLSNKATSPHGIINGAKGNISAHDLQGHQLEYGTTVIDENTANVKIPVTVEGVTYNLGKESRIADGTVIVKFSADAATGGLLELTSTLSNVFAVRIGNNYIKSSGDGFEFLNNNKNTVAIKALAFVETSTIDSKNVKAEEVRDYVDYDKASLKRSYEDDTVYVSADDIKSFKDVYLGSALQALYELPIAKFHYLNEEESFKDYLGIIVERVNTIKDKVPGDRAIFENTTELKDKNAYEYSADELKSIKEYLTLLTNTNEDGAQITSIVGLLLKAAKETQERLLKVEESTFGVDAETIPGERDKISSADSGIISDPTYLGLNRIVRALSREIFYDPNPMTVHSTDGEKVDSLSRIDRIDAQVNGEAASSDVETLPHSLDKTMGKTYPDEVEIPENSEEFTSIEFEGKSYNSNDQFIEDLKPKGIVQKDFDGLNDAVNRIVKKLNALTENVNGTDNIDSRPIRLETIRSNIKNILEDVFWVNDVDDGRLSDDSYNGKRSRIDVLTEKLYDFKVNDPYTYIKNEENNNSPKMNGHNFVVGENKNNVPTQILVDTDNNKEVSNGFDDYDKANIIDVIVDTIGSDKYIKRQVNYLVDDPNTLLKDCTTGEFDNYDIVNSLGNFVTVSDARGRITKSILDRLFNIENALDAITKKVTGENFESTSDDNFLLSAPAAKVLQALERWTGVTYDKETDKWVYYNNGKIEVTADKLNASLRLDNLEDRETTSETRLDDLESSVGAPFNDYNAENGTVSNNLRALLGTIFGSPSAYVKDDISSIHNDDGVQVYDNVNNRMRNIIKELCGVHTQENGFPKIGTNSYKELPKTILDSSLLRNENEYTRLDELEDAIVAVREYIGLETFDGSISYINDEKLGTQINNTTSKTENNSLTKYAIQVLEELRAREALYDTHFNELDNRDIKSILIEGNDENTVDGKYNGTSRFIKALYAIVGMTDALDAFGQKKSINYTAINGDNNQEFLAADTASKGVVTAAVIDKLTDNVSNAFSGVNNRISALENDIHNAEYSAKIAGVENCSSVYAYQNNNEWYVGTCKKYEFDKFSVIDGIPYKESTASNPTDVAATLVYIEKNEYDSSLEYIFECSNGNRTYNRAITSDKLLKDSSVSLHILH